MYLTRKKYHYHMVFFCLCFSSKLSFAFEIQTGVGGGLQYTSNARLAAADKVDDTIATGYVGLGVSEDEGPLVYGADATLRRENYLNDTFADRNYLNLGLNSKWEMVRDRFNWFAADRFNQRPIVSTAADTPNNTQDTNYFNFGANINFPVSVRHRINITPEFRQFNYQRIDTDNRQYVISGSWNYQAYRLLNIGLNGSIRTVDYFEPGLINTTFSNASINFVGQPVRSNYTINLGTTNVSRENGQSTSGFAGSASLQKELSSRSTIEASVSTALTDTSTASLFDAPGNSDDVQITTDVVRNRVGTLAYYREDALLRTRLSGAYRELIYSENETLNRSVNTFRAQLDFPVTQLISGGVFLLFDNVDLPNAAAGPRNDKRFNFGATASISFTQKLNGNARVLYRTKESTTPSLNYDEFSIFAGLSYGIGSARGRTTSGR